VLTPPPVRLAPPLPPVSPARQVRSLLRLATRPSADPRKWLLFAQGRTGSTLLGELLGSHPDVVFADEILEARVRAPRLWVEGQRRRHPGAAFGFHVKIYQLTDVQGVRSPGDWLAAMHARGWRILALRRRNTLRHVLSNMTIAATGTVHDRTGAERSPALTVDPDDLLFWMRARTAVGAAEQEALSRVPHESFVYEDDLLDAGAWDATATRAFAHLGVPPAPVTVELRRRNAGRLEDLVANYREVAAVIRDSEFAEHLDD
jgi:hypothetical protein